MAKITAVIATGGSAWATGSRAARDGTTARKKRERERGSVGGKGRRKGGTMIGTAKIFWLGLNELNDEKVLKRNILVRDLIW